MSHNSEPITIPHPVSYTHLMSGGIGTIGGTIVGALVINVLNDGMTMMGVSSFWQQVIRGVVIVVAVVIDQLQASLQKKIALQLRNQ